MGLDIYSDIIVGRKLSDIPVSKLIKLAKKQLGVNFTKEEMEYLKEETLQHVIEGGGAWFKLDAVFNYENPSEDTTYLGIQLGGGWWETYELKKKDIEKAENKFIKLLGLKPSLYVIPQMSY